MIDGEPVLLIASVSAYEAENLEHSLQPRGWSMRRVDHADHAAQQLRRCGRRVAVLVIDAGLLEMPHDGQWRRLRELHPRLATIVRCLLPEEPTPGATRRPHDRVGSRRRGGYLRGGASLLPFLPVVGSLGAAPGESAVRLRRPPPRRMYALRPPARPTAQGALIHVTLGRLVEAVAASTADLAEQVAVLHHVLQTCGRP